MFLDVWFGAGPDSWNRGAWPSRSHGMAPFRCPRRRRQRGRSAHRLRRSRPRRQLASDWTGLRSRHGVRWLCANRAATGRDGWTTERFRLRPVRCGRREGLCRSTGAVRAQLDGRRTSRTVW